MTTNLEMKQWHGDEDYQTLFDDLPLMMHVLDGAYNIVAVNDIWLERLGYRREDVIGQTFLDFVSREFVDVPKSQAWQQQFETQGTVRDVYLQLLKKDGSIFETQLTSIARRQPDLADWRILSVCIDLKGYRARMEEAMEQHTIRIFRQFMNDVAHDFRSPLSAINTGLYFIERADNPETRQRYVERIRRNVDRLDRQFNNMLLMIGLESAEQFSYQQLDINETLRQVVRRMQSTIEQKEQTISLKPAPSLPMIYVDEERLYQALLNIVSNAVQFTPQQGNIMVSTERSDGDLLCIQVSDTGPGIAAEDLPYIFERFYRTNQARTADKGGSGLGLTIARRIIQLHGGHINVESEPGIGSRFQVYLPLHDTD